jgi:hypothetical protein
MVNLEFWWKTMKMMMMITTIQTDVALVRSSDRYDRSDWWRTRRWQSRLLMRHDANPCNRYTATPLVINQAQLEWPCQ